MQVLVLVGQYSKSSKSSSDSSIKALELRGVTTALPSWQSVRLLYSPVDPTVGEAVGLSHYGGNKPVGPTVRATRNV